MINTVNIRRVLVPIGNPVGGIRTYLIYNLRSLHDVGYRFTFLAPEGEGFDNLKKDTQDWQGTEYLEIPIGKNSLFVIRNILKKYRFDLIHSQGIRFGTLTAGANFFRNIPHIITLHDVIIPGLNDFGRFSLIKRSLAAFVTRRASYIIPVSNDCKNNHVSFFPAWKKGPVLIKLILNGVNVDRLQYSQKQLEIDRQLNVREQFRIGNDIILGGFFGRFMPQKGFDLLLQALAVLARQGYRDRFHIIATTDHNGYLNETLRDTASNPDVAQMVHFLPAVPDITPLLLQTDVLVMPSRYEACPLLPMESLVLGTPVIGTDGLGLREVLAGTPSMIVPKENPDALAAAIVSFIENPQPIKDAAQHFVADAVMRFDVHAATKQLFDIYQSFASVS